MRIRRLSLYIVTLLVLLVPLSSAFAAPDTVLQGGLDRYAASDEHYLRTLFPKLHGTETRQTRFVFSSAPAVLKTSAMLGKNGEMLMLYRFETVQDYKACKAMIVGNTVSKDGSVVYPDTRLPATYYYNNKKHLLLLYFGADEAVNETLTGIAGFRVAGMFGGYFDDRNSIEYGDMVLVSVAKLDGSPRPTYRTPLQEAEEVCIGTIRSVKEPKAGIVQDFWPYAVYDVEIRQTRKGNLKDRVQVLIERGVVWELNRSYVFCLDEKQNSGGIYWPCGGLNSLFEIDDRGYILPIREYGMKAPVKLDTFLKLV